MTNLEDLNFKYIEKRTGRAKQIQWNESWDDKKPTKEQLDYVKALASAQNEALEIISAERDKALAGIAILERAVSLAEEALHIQKKINIKAITDSNERINSLVSENKNMALMLHKK